MYFLSIDQGTTGTTAAIIDAENFNFLYKCNTEFKQHYPSPGQVEHDLNEIWSTVEKSVQTVMSTNNIKPSEIKSIGITNQRETICAFTKDGTPLAKAIVWQDRRTQERCLDLKKHEELIKSKTGLPIDPYFSGTKIEWLIKNNHDIQNALKEDNCLFGTIDTFLIFKLTDCLSHKTESSNASRTLLFNINKGNWDDELCELLSVPQSTLPDVQDSFSIFGKTKNLSFLNDDIPISGCLGDQQSALFGQGCFASGESKCTYGTGAFFLVNTGQKRVDSANGILTTIAYQKNGELFYALEGSCYIAGAAVQWLRDNLKIIPSSPDVEALAVETDEEKMKNILMLPFFTGIASPYWKSEATASIIGLTRDTGNSEIARACLEGIALSINDLLNSIQNDLSGIGEIKKLIVDGGATQNNFLLELQASFSKIKVIRPKVIETTAYGAAFAAALGLGEITIDDLKSFWHKDREFNPSNSNYFKMKKSQWEKYIQRLYLN